MHEKHCRICGQAHDETTHGANLPLDPWIVRALKTEFPRWRQNDRACETCVESLLDLCNEAERLAFQ